MKRKLIDENQACNRPETAGAHLNSINDVETATRFLKGPELSRTCPDVVPIHCFFVPVGNANRLQVR